jgi:peptidyl-dipeptidase Dcp
MTNPLLAPTPHDHDAFPFDELRDEHFAPAFDAVLAQARANLDRLRADASPPTFDNTLEALETASERLELVSSVYSNLLSAHTNDALQRLAREVMPKLAEFSNDVFLDAALFGRVRAVWERRESLGLDTERRKLLDDTHRSFVRNGALLPEADKTRLRALDQRLAVLGQQFSDNVLAETNAFELVLTDRSELAGLPDGAIEAAALTAKERGRGGAWVFTLHQPSLLPFLKFSERRELRERIWRAAQGRAMAGEHDNREILKEIATLRFDRARLLGHETHAHFVLEERMAATPAGVRAFLARLLPPSRAAAERDLAELRVMARRDGQAEPLKPWDVAFWSERLRREKYELDDEQLRPYFKLESVVAGVFEHARRLYGLTFKERRDLPVYHPDVKLFEVRDEATDAFVGLFYADFFPRASKRNGAWMTTFRSQGLLAGRVERPHVSIVCNLAKPTPTRPSLLDLDEVRTVFHEFGHSLHALLSKCRYRSLGGTNVYWDFVELPSQIMENWSTEKEGLDLFARHHETGERIPDAIIERIKAAAQFQAGWMSLRQLTFALLDFAFHADDPRGVGDVEAFERQATEPTRLFPHEPGTSICCAFSHIFAGGYSAGYYSYKWAEVLDADAFELFRERGLFDRETADRFRENVLERGGTEHPAELYRRFRGRDPDPDALLRRDALLSHTAESPVPGAGPDSLPR